MWVTRKLQVSITVLTKKMYNKKLDAETVKSPDKNSYNKNQMRRMEHLFDKACDKINKMYTRF